jgi:hypothetical protein
MQARPLLFAIFAFASFLFFGCQASRVDPGPVEVSDPEISGSFGGNPLLSLRRVPLLDSQGARIEVCIESVLFGDQLADLLPAPSGLTNQRNPQIGPQRGRSPLQNQNSSNRGSPTQLLDWPTVSPDTLPTSKFFFDQKHLPNAAVMIVSASCGQPYSIQVTSPTGVSHSLQQRVGLGFYREGPAQVVGESAIEFDLADLGSRLLAVESNKDLTDALHLSFGLFRHGPPGP